MAQQTCLALELGIAVAFHVDHVGQVIDAGIDLIRLDFDLGRGVEVIERDAPVIDAQFVEGDGQQLVHLGAPVGALTGLRVLLAAAVHEVDLRAGEEGFRDHCMVIPE